MIKYMYSLGNVLENYLSKHTQKKGNSVPSMLHQLWGTSDKNILFLKRRKKAKTLWSGWMKTVKASPKEASRKPI